MGLWSGLQYQACITPTSVLEFWSAWSCAGFVHIITATMINACNFHVLSRSQYFITLPLPIVASSYFLFFPSPEKFPGSWVVRGWYQWPITHVSQLCVFAVVTSHCKRIFSDRSWEPHRSLGTGISVQAAVWQWDHLVKPCRLPTRVHDLASHGLLIMFFVPGIKSSHWVTLRTFYHVTVATCTFCQHCSMQGLVLGKTPDG